MGDAGLTSPATRERLKVLVQPHVASFDYFATRGLAAVTRSLEPATVDDGAGPQLSLWLEDVHLRKPLVEERGSAAGRQDLRVLPRECREAGSTYSGSMRAKVCWRVGASGEVMHKDVRLGAFPIMVCSSLCHLSGLPAEKLVAHGEEGREVGGYFIINGNERIIRLLVQQRRHYIMGMIRGAYARRGPAFTEYATAIRCVAADETAVTVRLHYLTSGSARVAFVIRRQEFFIPAAIVMRALMDTSDAELFAQMVGALPGSAAVDTFAAERAEVTLAELGHCGLRTSTECRAYLGRHFRGTLGAPASASDAAVGARLLREELFVHLPPGARGAPAKLRLLMLMFRKLYALVSGACRGDNPDTLQHQEVLLPGLLLQQFVKERLAEWCEACVRAARDGGGALDDPNVMARAISKTAGAMDLGRRVDYFLATGNLVSRSGLGMSQASGFTVVAEKLNYLRYLSHFRSVHRGAYFAELRTTTVRKLLPEAWGFVCPVHTPDGSPCGLLNHLTAAARVVVPSASGDADADADGADGAAAAVAAEVAAVLAAGGMLPAAAGLVLPGTGTHVPVLCDGVVLGALRAADAAGLVTALRARKAGCADEGGDAPLLPAHLEVALVLPEPGGAYPGLYLFSSPARLVRPVVQLSPGRPVELIGTLEQVYMSVSCPDGGLGGSADLAPTHTELGPAAFLSAVAGMTPFSDYNQSPRNMYQCQMAKQTMGTPLHSHPYRSDNKLYRLQSPQRPIARTAQYDRLDVDEYALGTMAVVAVLAYTGYDMEDAMIINRAALDRGFAHASLYKTETVDLREGAGRGGGAAGARLFANDARSPAASLDSDGMPQPGATLAKGDVKYGVMDTAAKAWRGARFTLEDSAAVDSVTLVGAAEGKPVPQRATVKLRFNRNPIIGDKFASRAGQKGTLSFCWPDTDLPFAAATGMRPDIIINPHAFPSRMTIGMLVESMSSKAGAHRGMFVDATPFAAAAEGVEVVAAAGDGEEEGQGGRGGRGGRPPLLRPGAGVAPAPGKQQTPTEMWGEELLAAGFAHHGGETMVSGVTGEEFAADIFVGLVYYQRLRHMVSDKFQVRSVGAINPTTRQPIKGRAVGGGIRFGEMERDALLAHGAAFLLHDRLHTCSDRHVADVCSACGSLLAPQALPSSGGRRVCSVCGTGAHVESVAMPYVFRYLATELAAMNIKLQLALV